MGDWSGVERRSGTGPRPEEERRAPLWLSVRQEGMITGLLGAGAVAAWFLVVDTLAGRPFFTPAMLGSATFHGLRDPALVEVTIQNVAGYTFEHFAVFAVIGVIAAGLCVLTTSVADRLDAPDTQGKREIPHDSQQTVACDVFG